MRQIDGLYYMTHLDNLDSLLERGIYSHEQVSRRKIQARRVHDGNVMDRRKRIRAGERTLWEYVNLYFQPRNAMMYRLTRRYPGNIVLIKLRLGFTLDELRKRGVWITDGNAASGNSKIDYVSEEFLKIVRENIDRESWGNDEEKRRMMAECLVPVHVSSGHFVAIVVPNRAIEAQVKQMTGLETIIDAYQFFG